MDVKYYREMLLRGIGKAELPIVDIELGNKDNSLLYISTENKDKFQVKVEKIKGKNHIPVDKMKHVKIKDIYESFASSRQCNELLLENELDICCLKDVLDYEEYYQLENHILDYSSKNDQILFEAGFRHAWSLFCDCIRER